MSGLLAEPARPSDAIRALACGYASHDRAEKLLVMFQSFADDSTSPLGGKRLFLAAYVNTVPRWESFSDEWAAALKEHPRIEYAKMSEAESLRGQFRGWDPIDRDRKIMRLAQIVQQSQPWSFHTSVDTADCARIMGPAAPLGLARPYMLCFQALVIQVARYHCAIGGGGLPLDFVFDDQGGVGEEAALLYNWIKSTTPPDVQAVMGARPIFRDDKAVRPLQAADLLAWHVRRWREGQDTHETRPALDLLVAPGRHVFVELGEPELQRLAKGLRRVPGVKPMQSAKGWREAKRGIAAWIDAGHAPPAVSRWRMRMRYLRYQTRGLYRRFRRAWRVLTKG